VGRAGAGAGAGSEDLLHRVEIRIEATGFVEREIRVIRFDTPEAAQQRGNQAIGVRVEFEDLTLNRAFVVGRDGTRTALDPSTIQIQTRNEPDLYSDVVDVIVPMPAVAPGSIAVLDSTQRFRFGGWPLPWSRLVPLRGISPIRRFELVVEWSEGLDAPVVGDDDSELDCEPVGPRGIQCTADALPAVAFEDAADASAFLDQLPLALVSAPMTWDSLRERYGAVVDSRALPTPAIQLQTKHLLEGAASDAERLGRLHRFVADEIRYLGLEHGSSAVVPHTASETLVRRYGDCKDKVTLFLAMARSANLSVHPVLVSTRFTTREKLFQPSWQWFDHLIACAADTCFDLTAPYYPSGMLPYSVQGQVALDVSSGPGAPRTIAADRFALDLEVETRARIECDGGFEERVTRRLRGSWASILRSLILGMPEDQRQTWLQEEFDEAYGADEKARFQIENLGDVDEPLAIVTTTRFDQGSPLMEAPFADRDPWLAYYVHSFEAEGRTQAHRNRGMRYVSRAEYEICPEFRAAALGAELDLAARFGTMKRRYARSNGGIEVETTFELPSSRVTGSERDALNRFLERILGESRVWFEIERSPDATASVAP